MRARARVENVPEIARAWLEGRILDERGRLEGAADEFQSFSRLEKNRQDTADIVTASANAVRTDPTRLQDSLELAREAFDASGLNETARATGRRESDQAITVAYVQGLNESNPDLAREVLSGGSIDATISPEAKNILVNDNQVELRRRDALQRAAVTSARAEIRDVIKLLEQGFDPGSETLTRLAGIAGTDKALAADLHDALRIYEFQRTARKSTPGDLQNWINDERVRLVAKKGVTTAESARLGSAEALLSKMNTGLSRDPLSWAARAGVADIEPLVIVGEDAPASIAERKRDAETVGNYYGLPPRYLTDEDASQLTALVKGLDVDGQLSLAANLAGFGDAAPQVFEDIANKGGDIFAHVGGLVTIGAAAAARDILVGEAAIEAGIAVPPAVERESGSALGRGAFALSPTTAGVFERAQTSIYVARAQRRGKGAEAGEFDEELWLRSGQDAAGAIYGAGGRQFGGISDAWNGWPVVVPADIPLDDFTDTIAAINDEDLALVGAAFADGAAFTATDLNNAWLVSAGHGRYRIAMSDPADGDVVWVGVAGGTRPVILDLIALLPALRTRPRDQKLDNPEF